MNQIRLYFILISLFCAFSCRDNGDPEDYHQYAIEGIYPDLTFGRELILVYNGDTLSNKEIDFATRGLKQGILTFENVINGEAKTVLTVDLIESVNPDNNDITKYSFEGIYTTQSRPVTYSGYVEGLVLSLNIEE